MGNLARDVVCSLPSYLDKPELAIDSSPWVARTLGQSAVRARLAEAHQERQPGTATAGSLSGTAVSSGIKFALSRATVPSKAAR